MPSLDLAADAPPYLAPMASPTRRTVRAHKFGGSSVADAAHYRHVAALLQRHGDDTPRVVVVSAMAGVTDALTLLAGRVYAGDAWEPAFAALRERHVDAAAALDPTGVHALRPWLDAQFAALHAQLAASRDDATLLASVQGLGEVWSSRLMQAALGGTHTGWAALDARDVLVVRAGELGMAVDWSRSAAQLATWRQRHPHLHVVVTGFIARDADGHATTLGRNGSDYSGSIFAVLFDAAELTIWTDVDGVLSADPRLVPDAVCLPSMTYAEACELAYFGAKVLHPQTMAPAMHAGLPIRIRNTHRPDAPGTLIAAHAPAAQSPVKGLSLIEHMAVLELVGAGLIGVPGTAQRLFAALHAAGVSVTMISQGSSEHSICCVLREAQAEHAQHAVQVEFEDALRAGQVEDVRITRNIAVLAAVGEGMVGTPGVAARLLDSLAQARINVRAIAQGASERNISIALHADDALRALRVAHAAFWLSRQTIAVGVIGPGHVGRALLAQLAQAASRYGGADRKLDLQLRAIADSRSMHLASTRLAPAAALDALQTGGPVDLDRFADHLQSAHLPHALIVDCSGSDAVAAHYARWLAAGIHVVTPNKQAGSGDIARYREIQAASRTGGHFRYEATVGAGLPVIQTLRGLLDTGDALRSVDGILSGTLAWLFNRFDGTRPFSSLVLEARALGYTEPDPRDDLSGLDVARKLVILAREAGRELSLDDVAIESLVPPHLRDVSRDAFLDRIGELDEAMAARLADAKAQGGALRYLAQLDADGRARVALVVPPEGHASLHGRLTDNLIELRTARYADNPLVVQGPGAGPEVTAAGVFGDMLAIAQALGARL